MARQWVTQQRLGRRAGRNGRVLASAGRTGVSGRALGRDTVGAGSRERRAGGVLRNDRVSVGGSGGLLHHESGTFVWQGVARPAERTLRFLPSPDGTADVRFADGLPFHDLDLTSGRYVADHPCAADLYRGEFTVRDADHWRTVWRVRGPAKDVVLRTDYAREG